VNEQHGPAAEAAEQRRRVRAWCLYDWANSAFATSVTVVFMPLFYQTVAAAPLEPTQRTALYAYTTAFSTVLIALLAPILGAVADMARAKKRFLAAFAGLGILFTSALPFVGEGAWRVASAFFMIASLGFAGSLVFYDSLLPHVARPEEIDRVSARGFAWGYCGGGVLLALQVAAFVGLGPSRRGAVMRGAFVTTALWWLIFMQPLLRRVPEPGADAGAAAVPPWRLVAAAFRQIWTTLRHLGRYRQAALFLVAFYFYNDGIQTVIKMATSYGGELDLPQAAMVGAVLATQFVAMPFAILFGRLAGWIGVKRAILLAVGVYIAISIVGFGMTRVWHFWVLAILVGTVQGGAQALSRSLFGSMVPRSRSAEFFGFYSVSTKFAGILGPFIFGVISQRAGSSRLSILALVSLFLVGGALLWRVDEQKGRAQALAG